MYTNKTIFFFFLRMECFGSLISLLKYLEIIDLYLEISLLKLLWLMITYLS